MRNWHYYDCGELRFKRQKNIPTKSYKVIKEFEELITKCQSDPSQDSMEQVGEFALTTLNNHLENTYKIQAGFLIGNGVDDIGNNAWTYGQWINDGFHYVNQQEIDNVKSLKRIESLINLEINITVGKDILCIPVWWIVCETLRQKVKESDIDMEDSHD